MMNVNGATHKRVFYRVISGGDEHVAKTCQTLANLINECNGRVYGTTPAPTMDNALKVIMSFEIPTLVVQEFLSKEKSS